MGKLKKKNMSELIDILKVHPYGTEEHTKIHSFLAQKVDEVYPNEFVLCTTNRFNNNAGVGSKLISLLGEITDFKEVLQREYISAEETAFENNMLVFKSRKEVEYNFAYKQINVFGFITDGTKYMFLKKPNKKITMIGGHVDFTEKAYKLTQVGLLQQAMQQELDEEILSEQRILVDQEPVALVNTFNEWNDIFHMAFIYKIHVKSVDDLFNKSVSGEPHKHSLVKFDSLSELANTKKLHQWISVIQDYL